LLARLDGTATLDEVWQAVVAEQGDAAPGQTEVMELLGRLQVADLLRSDRLLDVELLTRRRDKLNKPLWWRNLANPLSVRWPLWDCDAFLARWSPPLLPLLGPLGALLWLAWVLPARWLAWQHGQELAGNLHDQLLAPANLLLLLLVFPLVKLVHELAHGLAARAFGVPVHEMGLMFLVLAPVPYVEASAAHALRSRWQRAFVGAAGMVAELALAAAALYAWLLLEPGTTRSVMHSVLLIAGLSTLLFNGNPLLRFDGYYVLCDLIEVPNLGPRAGEHWLYLLRRHLLGDRDLKQPAATAGERRWFVLYQPAALAYRLALTLAIALFVAQEYPVVGLLLAAFAIGSGWLLPLGKGLLFLLASPALARHRLRALAGAAAALGLPVFALLAVPVPARVVAEGLVWVPACAEVRAGEAGRVAALLRDNGSPVAAGEPVLAIESPELDAAYAAASARVRQLDVRVTLERGRDRTQAGLLADQLAQEREQLALLEARKAALAASSCLPGVLELQRPRDLPGQPVARGDLLGVVRSERVHTVRVVVPQDDIGLVRAGPGRARVMLADRIGQVADARVLRETPGGDSRLPAAALSIAGGGPHAVDPSDREGLRTLSRVFQLDLEVPAGWADARVGTRAHVRFELPPQPLAQQWGLRLRQLFLARLDV
jgi:putative peptide zinc metalloprotease protein